MPERESRSATSFAAKISSRTVALTLTCGLLTVLALAGIVPQSASVTSAVGFWKRPDVHGVVHALALDRILNTWPVALLFAATAVSIAVATARHSRVAYRRTFAIARNGRGTPVADPDALRTALRRAGFLRTSFAADAEKHVRNPWGHWGGVTLHAGLLLTLAALLLVSATEWRGVALPAEGDAVGPASRFVAEVHGVLAPRAALPETFTVAAAAVEYWGDHTPRQVETTLAFASDKPLGLRVNAPAVRDGITFYQGQEHGHTFLVTVTRPDGSTRPLRLDMTAPDSPAEVSYFGSAVPDGAYSLRAKYFVDAEKRSMNGVPLLVLRLEKGGAELARAELRPGETARLGEYAVKLDGVAVWTELVMVRTIGMPLVFLGFALVIAGAALIYLTPPAAVLLLANDDGTRRLVWQPSRFARELPAELAALLQRDGEAA
jgi:cytochrome c biogenesis protein